MLRKALREANLLFLMSPHPRWAACWLVSELVAKKGRRLRDAVQLRVVGCWWGRMRWIARSGSLYPDAPGGMDTFYCCTDGRQMWDCGKARLLARYRQQTHVVTKMIYQQQTFGFQIVVQSFKGCSDAKGLWSLEEQRSENMERHENLISSFLASYFLQI